MKRFSETTRFADAWYFDLPPLMKCAWEYVWANCDNAGVWNVNTKLADMQIGGKVAWDSFLEKSDGRIVQLDARRWFIAGFVAFQFGKLSEACRPHVTVIALLRSHGLLKEDGTAIDYPIDYPKGFRTLQDKDKEQDKEQDQYGGVQRGVAKDNLPTTAEAKMVADLFRRRHSTQWSDDEIKTFKRLTKDGTLTVESMQMISAWYKVQREHASPERATYHTDDLTTFLNNFNKFLDRATNNVNPPSAKKTTQVPYVKPGCDRSQPFGTIANHQL